jgi:hypothetical protein
MGSAHTINAKGLVTSRAREKGDGGRGGVGQIRAGGVEEDEKDGEWRRKSWIRGKQESKYSITELLQEAHVLQVSKAVVDELYR